MNKAIEIFNWKHEGEYDQYFFMINYDTEEEFIAELKAYLNNIWKKNEYPWNDPLQNFKEEIQFDLGINNYMVHLEETIFLNFSYSKGFTLTRNSKKIIQEDI